MLWIAVALTRFAGDSSGKILSLVVVGCQNPGTRVSAKFNRLLMD